MFGMFSPAKAQSANIVYYGGPVVSNPQIVTVNWNGNVGSIAANTLPQFYADITANNLGNNGYWNVLSSYYSTLGAVPQDNGASSGQLIGPGSALASSITISPALCPTTASTAVCSLVESDVDTELNHQIDLGVLPAPVSDAQGNVNTIYLLNFPPYVQLSLGIHQTSCIDFCSLNSTLVRGSQNIAVGFLPDIGGPGCSTGCGSSTVLNNSTANASQLLVDAVTDPQVGIGPAVGRPLAWIDGSSGDELADPCRTSVVDFQTPSGRTWTVGKIWVVGAAGAGGNSCAATFYGPNGFGLSATPGSIRVRPGENVAASIGSISEAGSAQNIGLSTDPLPAGITVSFTPSTLAAVGTDSSALQFSADRSTALGVYNINVLGIAQTGERAVTGFVLTVTDVIFADGFE
jgi:hypothetical protein